MKLRVLPSDMAKTRRSPSMKDVALNAIVYWFFTVDPVI
jgi:hypothetical protein